MEIKIKILRIKIVLFIFGSAVISIMFSWMNNPKNSIVLTAGVGHYKKKA